MASVSTPLPTSVLISEESRSTGDDYQDEFAPSHDYLNFTTRSILFKTYITASKFTYPNKSDRDLLTYSVEELFHTHSFSNALSQAEYITRQLPEIFTISFHPSKFSSDIEGYVVSFHFNEEPLIRTQKQITEEQKKVNSRNNSLTTISQETTEQQLDLTHIKKTLLSSFNLPSNIDKKNCCFYYLMRILLQQYNESTLPKLKNHLFPTLAATIVREAIQSLPEDELEHLEVDTRTSRQSILISRENAEKSVIKEICSKPFEQLKKNGFTISEKLFITDKILTPDIFSKISTLHEYISDFIHHSISSSFNLDVVIERFTKLALELHNQYSESSPLSKFIVNSGMTKNKVDIDIQSEEKLNQLGLFFALPNAQVSKLATSYFKTRSSSHTGCDEVQKSTFSTTKSVITVSGDDTTLDELLISTHCTKKSCLNSAAVEIDKIKTHGKLGRVLGEENILEYVESKTITASKLPQKLIIKPQFSDEKKNVKIKTTNGEVQVYQSVAVLFNTFNNQLLVTVPLILGNSKNVTYAVYQVENICCCSKGILFDSFSTLNFPKAGFMQHSTNGKTKEIEFSSPDAISMYIKEQNLSGYHRQDLKRNVIKR